jgi:hypothetical protein
MTRMGTAATISLNEREGQDEEDKNGGGGEDNNEDNGDHRKAEEDQEDQEDGDSDEVSQCGDEQPWLHCRWLPMAVGTVMGTMGGGRYRWGVPDLLISLR